MCRSQLAPIAELDGAGAIVSRFVHATRVNVPDYLIRDGATYRILADHLGSPRLVIDTTTGAVVQRMDFDEWGVVLADTNPGWTPFGFTGGLYEAASGLVRFGARDFEASSGRWTSKDPIGFGSQDSNLFRYTFGDGINLADPSGATPFAFIAAGPSGDVGQALSILWSYYQQMRDRRIPGADRYFHCVAHCYASAQGPVGRATSEASGLLREEVDFFKNVLRRDAHRLSPRDSLDDCVADLDANAQGRHGEPETTCEDRSANLRPAGMEP